MHERAATDEYLLTERVRSDKDVSHRDDFLGMVVHDVRNLLNLVVLSLAMLRPGRARSRPRTCRRPRPASSSYVARMNRLIGDLVDVTSIDAGKLGVEAVEGRRRRACWRKRRETFQPAALEKGVSFSTGVPPGPLRAVFDHDRVLQVFANLLSNSIKFTPREGKIDVSVERTGGMLRFCVSDTGVGIAAPMLEAVFERFWQVGKDDRRGMGLGLYISKCIVESHGGRIWAESKVGKGSQFYFTLPVTAARPRRSTARVAAAGQDAAPAPGQGPQAPVLGRPNAPRRDSRATVKATGGLQ